MKSTIGIAYFQLHLSIFLWGFAAIMGDLISLSALTLVWWRVGLATLILGLFSKSISGLSRVQKGDLLSISLTGGILGLHWVAFYGSIKMANASVALATLCAVSLFTAILNPLLNSIKVNKTNVIFGFLIIPPLLVIGGSLGDIDIKGFFLGIVAAFLLALFVLRNKRHVENHNSFELVFLELGSATILLGVAVACLLFVDENITIIPQQSDWILLCLFVFGCTIAPFILNLKALNVVSAFTSNLVANLEPVYGVFFAAILLNDHEELTLNFYLAVLFMFLLIFIHMIFYSNPSNLKERIPQN